MDLAFIPWIRSDVSLNSHSLHLLDLDYDSIRKSLPLRQRLRNLHLRFRYYYRLIEAPNNDLKTIGLARFYTLLLITITSHLDIFTTWNNASYFYNEAFLKIDEFVCINKPLLEPILNNFALSWTSFNQSIFRIQRWFRKFEERRELKLRITTIYILNKHLNFDLTLILLMYL